jgi:hypothetical protein
MNNLGCESPHADHSIHSAGNEPSVHLAATAHHTEGLVTTYEVVLEEEMAAQGDEMA